MRVAVLLVFCSCIHAPEIVLVDRATALEQQAAGSYKELEDELARAGIAARPAQLTPDQLQTLGMSTSTFADDTTTTDADRVDDLLRRHCIGEGRSGLLVDTPESCQGALDRTLAAMLVTRSNEARVQLWKWMREQRPNLTVEQVQRAWTDAHARGVVCGGWMEQANKQWEAKKC